MHEIEYIAISKAEYDRLKAIEVGYLAELHERNKQAEDQIRMYQQQMQLSSLGFPMSSGLAELDDMNEQ